ncbi:MAG: glyoxalase, partial [Candidatus Eremiobacterota bacterium]
MLFILYVADQARSKGFYRCVLQVEPCLDVPGMTEFPLPGGARLGLMPEAGIARLLGDAVPHPARGSGLPRCEVYLSSCDPAAAGGGPVEARARQVSPAAPRG